MLKLNTTQHQARNIEEKRTDFLPQLDLLSILRLFSRHWPRFVIVLALVFSLAVAYQITGKRRYSASFSTLVSTKDKDILAANADTGSYDRLVDPGAIESQVEIIKSANVIREAVRKLKLTHDEMFMTNGGRSLLAPITRFFNSFFESETGPPSEAELEQTAIDNIAVALKAKRVGVTYVVEVTYTGVTPDLTFKIATALADAYLSSELEARYESSRRATEWFKDRLLGLRRDATVADTSVQHYKVSNNIVDTSHGLIDEAQLSDVSSQLVTAEAATAEAKAKLDRVESVIDSDFANAAVSDALRSDVISRLRAQYLDLSSRMQDLSRRYGSDHQVVIDLKRQMADIASAAKEELTRIAQADRSDYEIAHAREQSLRESLKQLISKVGESNESQVALRNLESAAQAYRNMYDAFLQKFQQTAQEQTVPVDVARLITPPEYPDKPSWPKPLIVLGGGLVAGAIFGFVAIVLTEMFGNGFKTPDDVRNYAGLECLGTLPRLSRRRVKRLPRVVAGVDEIILGQQSPLARQVLLEPFSRFTETVRNAKVSIDLSGAVNGAPIIGIVSAVPKEGKSTFSANIALLTAQMGHRTLLIDGDLHSPSLTATLAPHCREGILEALANPADLDKVIITDSNTGLCFIPAFVPKRLLNAAEVLRSRPMIELLDAARARYDYIFIDLPPLLPVVDARAAAFMFDCFIYMIDWQKTSRDVVRDAMMSAEPVRQRIIGCILNKADPSELRRIESYRGPAYGSYYVDSKTA